MAAGCCPGNTRGGSSPLRAPSTIVDAVEPERVILGSARKHGVADDDMLHAIRNVLYATAQDDGVTMLVGPARDAGLMQVGVKQVGDLTLVLHAYRPARDKFLPGR